MGHYVFFSVFLYSQGFQLCIGITFIIKENSYLKKGGQQMRARMIRKGVPATAGLEVVS